MIFFLKAKPTSSLQKGVRPTLKKSDSLPLLVKSVKSKRAKTERAKERRAKERKSERAKERKSKARNCEKRKSKFPTLSVIKVALAAYSCIIAYNGSVWRELCMQWSSTYVIPQYFLLKRENSRGCSSGIILQFLDTPPTPPTAAFREILSPPAT